jgi:hypothetical protein
MASKGNPLSLGEVAREQSLAAGTGDLNVSAPHVVSLSYIDAVSAGMSGRMGTHAMPDHEEHHDEDGPKDDHVTRAHDPLT